MIFTNWSGVLLPRLFKTIRKASTRSALIWRERNLATCIAPSNFTPQSILEFMMKFDDESNKRLFYKKYMHPLESGVSIDATALPNQIDLDSMR